VNKNIAEALTLILAAATMNATYTLPMKIQRSWQWEHSWCAFSVLGIAVVPTIITVTSVPQLWSIYHSTPAAVLLAMTVFGFGWGVSQVFFGLSLPLVGVALAFTVSLSTSAASGAILPLLLQHPERIPTAQGAFVLAAIVLISIGVLFCGRAGIERERMSGKSEARTQGSGFVRGFIFSVLAGVLGSLLNLGLAYGDGIQEAAHLRGASSVMMSNAVWLPCVLAGFLPGVIYSLYVMKTHGVVGEFAANARWYYWPAAMLMGALWYGSILVYAFATIRLGDIGTAIGWPIFLAAIVVASNIVGTITGEWKLSFRGPFRTLSIGLVFLMLAIVILGVAGTMHT
jgi:L-rhamnose-H+ transport protein